MLDKWYGITNRRCSTVNLVKIDSYISSKEEGEARLKHLISAYRQEHKLPELTEDGGAYADGIKRSTDNPISRSKSIIKKRRHHHSGGEHGTFSISSVVR